MGCASSKQKRTKSLDDIQAGIKGSAANGQVTKEDGIKKNVDQHNSTSNPIQIPGTNKSFLAPDGIPFIDEDVEEDDTRMRSGKAEDGKTANNNNTSALAASPVGHKLSTKVAVNSNDVSVSKPQVSPVKKEEEEAAIKIQAGVRGFLDRKKVQSAKKNSKKVEEEKPIQPVIVVPKYDENTAATKIQANYKGYKTRKELCLDN